MNNPPAGPRLSDRQRLAWLRLIRTQNVGPATFRDLINRFGSADAALDMLPELMISGGVNRLVRIPSLAEAESEMEIAHKFGARFVGIGEPDYPPLLKIMDHPPPLLAIKGEGAVFRLPMVAIVGARNASLAGIKMARTLAAELGRDGYGIVSGLARGASTPPPTRAASRPARWACSQAVSIGPIRLKTSAYATKSASAAARSFLKCHSAGRREPRISRAATV